MVAAKRPAIEKHVHGVNSLTTSPRPPQSLTLDSSVLLALYQSQTPAGTKALLGSPPSATVQHGGTHLKEASCWEELL